MASLAVLKRYGIGKTSRVMFDKHDHVSLNALASEGLGIVLEF